MSEPILVIWVVIFGFFYCSVWCEAHTVFLLCLCTYRSGFISLIFSTIKIQPFAEKAKENHFFFMYYESFRLVTLGLG